MSANAFNEWLLNVSASILEQLPLPRDDVYYTDSRFLLYALPLTALLILYRYVMTRICYEPLARWLGIRPRKQRPITQQAELEAVYRATLKPGRQEFQLGAMRIGWSEMEVARWFRVRRMADRPSKLEKFCENAFRANCYGVNFGLGLYNLWDKPWLWDRQLCWENHPNQNFDRGVWLYYTGTVAFFLSLATSHMFKMNMIVNRKGFGEMFVHHTLVIALIWFACIGSITRMGSIILLANDPAGLAIEISKMANMTKYYRICDFIYVLFTITWIVSRLILFPYVLVFDVTIGPPAHKGPVIYVISNIGLYFLLLMDIVWTGSVLRVLKNVLLGQVEGRDSVDDSAESNGEETTLTSKKEI